MTKPSIFSLDNARQYLIALAQEFVDRKYTSRADARQKSMGLAYVEAERRDLAREIANFTERMLRDIPSDLDAARAANPDLGFAIYAYQPGDAITLEIHAPDGQVFSWTGASEADVLLQAFPPDTDEAETPASADTEPTHSIFD